MPNCPECGATVAEGAASCPGCGATLTALASRKCDGCGESLPGDADACPVCGTLRSAAVCERHPERSARGQCVVCGRAVCEECNQGDAPTHICEAHAAIPLIQGWAQVYTTSDDIEAQLIQENLQAEGVDAQILSQKDHFTFTVDLGDLSPVRVLVPAFAYDDAQRVIRSHMDARGEIMFACPNCGEAYDEGARVCAECGAALA